MFMEAEKPHNLLSESWTTRKAGSVIRSKLEALRTRGADDVTPGVKGFLHYSKFQGQEV